MKASLNSSKMLVGKQKNRTNENPSTGKKKPF
jgi:hypothetical protein